VGAQLRQRKQLERYCTALAEIVNVGRKQPERYCTALAEMVNVGRGSGGFFFNSTPELTALSTIYIFRGGLPLSHRSLASPHNQVDIRVLAIR